MNHPRHHIACILVLALMAFGCKESGDDDEDTATDTAVDTVTDTGGDTTPADTTPADTTPADTTPADTMEDPTEDPTEDPSTDMVTDGDVMTDMVTDMETDGSSDVLMDGDMVEMDGPECTPVWGLINEFVPDETGSEGSADETFIEIRTVPGAVLDGATIEGVNGDGGTSFLNIDLTGTVDGDGFFVISEDASITNTDQVLSSLNGLQNGPDSLVLKDTCGNILDAVGYGTFSDTDTFSGEGSPVPMCGEGESLGRCPGTPGTVDTDDNSADFRVIATPTPGVGGPACD